MDDMNNYQNGYQPQGDAQPQNSYQPQGDAQPQNGYQPQGDAQPQNSYQPQGDAQYQNGFQPQGGYQSQGNYQSQGGYQTYGGYQSQGGYQGGSQAFYSSDLEQPLSVGDWVVTLILTCIPCVNLIMLFVWAFGSGTPRSKANWAKAQLIIMLVVFVLYFITAAILGMSFASVISQYQN